MKAKRFLATLWVWLLVGTTAVWAQTEPCANPPRDLSGEYVRNQTELSWITPEGQPDWISWSNGTYYSGVGLGEGVAVDIAHIFAPEYLAGHGTVIKEIDFFVADASLLDKVSVFAMQVNDEGTAWNILFDQAVANADVHSGEWTEVVLATPAVFDPAKDLVFGYSSIQTAVGYPYAVDNTNHEHGQGGRFATADGWGALKASNITGSWLIKALVEDVPADQPATKSARKSRKSQKALTPLDFKAESAVSEITMQTERLVSTAHILLTDKDGKRVSTPTMKEQSNLKALRTDEASEYPYYNIYCGGDLVGSTTGTFFSHTICNPTKAIYNYEVEYVASAECVSPRASVQVEAQAQAVAPIISASFAEDPILTDNPYCVLLQAQPVACASSYVYYNNSKLSGSTGENLGWNEDYLPYTGVYVRPIPGDSVYLSMSAVNEATVEESPRSDSILVCLTCLRGAPQIDGEFSKKQSNGLNVEVHFDRETLTHFVERNGEIIAETAPGAYHFTETLPDYGTYTYRIGSDCEGLGNMDDIVWGEAWVYEVEKPLAPARVYFRGHRNIWLVMQDEYAYWEDNEWKRIGADEIISGNTHWGEELNAKRFNDFSFEIDPIAHRKASNDSIIAFRMVDPNNADKIYTEWIPLPGYGDEIWYTASNLPGAKAFVFDGDDTDHHRYYASLEGLSGDDLRDELNRLLNEQKQVVTYGDLRTAYHVTDYWYEDLQEGGYTEGIWDMYSDYVTPGWGLPAETTGSAEATATINREHSLPKSWWGGDENEAYTDIMHVIPTNTVVNSMRGAFPYSEVAEPTQVSENGSKLGMSTFPGYSLEAFEPVDEYKGDFARIYFYMATCYADLDFTQSRYESAGGAVFTYANATTDFTDFGRNLFMKWAQQDPVSDKEIMRNNGVMSVQGNRNPFVDLPELADYLWGDKKKCLFYFDNSGECITPPCADLVFNAPFNGSMDGFTAVDKLGYQNWYNPNGSDYININGYKNGSNPNEDWLVSPAFDLADKKNAELTFEHAINYCQDEERLANHHTLWITSNYTGDPASTEWTQLPIGVMPTGSDWNWVTPTINIPAEFLVDNVRFAFKYLSDDQVSGQWEIKNLTLTATCNEQTVGVEQVKDEQLPVVYAFDRTIYMSDIPAGVSVGLYDVVGRCVSTRTTSSTHMELSVPTNGMYIINIADKVYKVVVK